MSNVDKVLAEINALEDRERAERALYAEINRLSFLRVRPEAMHTDYDYEGAILDAQEDYRS